MQKILIIEDEVSIRNVLARILKDENKNFVVDEASDGIEGLEKLDKGQYDLVICDIKMPKLDGTDVLTKSVESGCGNPFYYDFRPRRYRNSCKLYKKGCI